MKTNAITFKEGKAFAVCEDIPKEPFKCPKGFPKCDSLYCQCAVDEEDYKSALQRVKDNAILIREEDQDKAHNLIVQDYFVRGFDNYQVKEGTFYPLSVEVEIIEMCAHDSCPVDAGCEICKEPKRLARIVEEPEEKLPEMSNSEIENDSKIEGKAKEALALIHQFTTLTTTDEEENIFFQGFHSGWCERGKSVKDSEVEDQEYQIWMEHGTIQLGLSLEAAVKKEADVSRYVFNKLKEAGFSITRIKQ